MHLPLKQYAQLLATYLKIQWRRVVLLSVLLLGTIGLQLLNPQILRYFIDTARAGGANETLMQAATLFIGIALVQQVAAIASTYVSETIGWTATNALRRDLALHCLRLDMSFHNTHTPGELIERIDGDVTALANFFSQLVIRVLGNLLLLVGVLVLLAREDWRVGVAFTLFALVALLTLYRMRNFSSPHWVAGRQISAKQAGFLEERLAGTEDIRSSGAVAFTMRQLFVLMRELMHAYRKARLTGSIAGGITRLLYLSAHALGLGLGGFLYTRGVLTIGTVFLISYYAQTLAWPLEQISEQIQDLQKAGASVARVQALKDLQPTIQDGPGVALPPGALQVELDHVSFGYGAADLVLHDISFRLQPGRVLGLLGRTGSGKTTITRLLFRLYDPASGVVRLGDVNLPQTTAGELRQRVGMVTQEVQLFHATLRDNLTFFDRRIPDEHILAALAELELMPWYHALPNGLDTPLEGSGGLSAGEAQLIAFTRVFLRDPGLVILDEASSRLDPLTERLLERAIDRLLRGRTAIIVAHRLQTVDRADEIMILERGRIREYGTRMELGRNGDSHFAQLLRTGLEEALV